MQWTLTEVRSFGDVKFLRVIRAVVGSFKAGWVTTLRAGVYIVIDTDRLVLELPQILELMKVSHCLAVPLLGFLCWKLRGAHVYGHFTSQPEIRVAGNMD
jgi:hypothetical protein